MSRHGPRRRQLRPGVPAIILAAMVLAGMAWLSAGPAAGAGRASRLAVSARPVPDRRPEVELIARLGAPGGATAGKKASLDGVTVTFSVHLLEFSGAPLLVLGSATTDAAGTARLDYDPTFTGRQALVATATDAAGNDLATATTSYTATAAAHPLAQTLEAVRPDGAIGHVVVGVLLGIVALLWIVLVSVVVRVHRRAGVDAP